MIILPSGNENMKRPCTTQQIGVLVRTTRKSQRMTQQDLALVSGTGIRFIVDLEKGKATCELAKVLTVLHMLAIEVQLIPPKTGDAS